MKAEWYIEVMVVSPVFDGVVVCCILVLLRAVAVGAHECSHLLAAVALGLYGEALSLSNLLGIFRGRVCIPSAREGWRQAIVCHVGWLCSLLVALHALSVRRTFLYGYGSLWALASGTVALDSTMSDLLGVDTKRRSRDGFFFCGNFGLLLLEEKERRHVLRILETMIQATMMRGAQSGGLVTYVEGRDGMRGLRSRVVNNKRTDLSKMLLRQYRRDKAFDTLVHLSPPLPSLGGRKPRRDGGVLGTLYAGHTRFATSSKASFDGTHPHRWSPPRVFSYFEYVSGSGWQHSRRSVETYITHNGDLEYFTIGSKTFAGAHVQDWLERVTYCMRPTTVDSVTIAGLMEMIRCKGLWYQSIRFGYYFGIDRDDLDYEIPSKDTFEEIAKRAEEIFLEVVRTCDFTAASDSESDDSAHGGKVFLRSETTRRWGDTMRAILISRLLDSFTEKEKNEGEGAMMILAEKLGIDVESGELRAVFSYAVNGFFDNDLFQSLRIFISKAKGSFGVTASCSLDAHRQIVFCSRGQTMSLAFYPQLGMVLWGSELAAVKAAFQDGIADISELPGQHDDVTNRLDLDDLGGEVCLLDWGEGAATVRTPFAEMPEPFLVLNGRATVSLVQEELHKFSPIRKRMMPLQKNPLISAIPQRVRDSVGADILEIPKAIHNLQEDWRRKGLNRFTAQQFGTTIKARLKRLEDGTHDGSVDLLLTGCETSLWLAEQFACDMSIGLFGQEFSIPQTNFKFYDGSLNLNTTTVLIVSHSGGTFAPLAVSNLLQSYTKNIFVLTSEWDTQIGRALRGIRDGGFKFRVFSTNVGMRYAEPCSISVACTHLLLTLILEMIMKVTQVNDLQEASGGSFTNDDISQLEDNVKQGVRSLEEIVGCDREGRLISDSYTAAHLRRLGRRWAYHVLEVPLAWMLGFCYIMGTVVAGQPIVTALAGLAGMKRDTWNWGLYFTRIFDALIYIFIIQISIIVIRLIQRRPLFHRMTSRTVLVGDIPWVSQCAEAFLSKLFACAYSSASINVYSGNPADHLVHRFTHRVVRGGLLLIGRPDGRLISLTSAENSVSLALNQASSIQSVGSTVESITVGHNAYKLPLSYDAVYLNAHRKQYLCEVVLGRDKAMKESSLLSTTYKRRNETTTWKQWLDSKSSVKRTPEERVRSSQAYTDEIHRGSDALLGDFANLKGRDTYNNTTTTNSNNGFALNGMDGVKGMIAKPVKCVAARSESIHQTIVTSADIFVRYAENHITGSNGTSDASSESLKMRSNSLEEAYSSLNSSFEQLNSINSDDNGDDIYCKEAYFGENLEQVFPEVNVTRLIDQQSLSMYLFESRVASLQRCVAFFVLFHAMGKCVADFWSVVSFSLLGYDIGRTQSIMRIATTASPVSGGDVRERKKAMALTNNLAKVKMRLASALENYRSRKSRKEEKGEEEGREGGKYRRGVMFWRSMHDEDEHVRNRRQAILEAAEKQPKGFNDSKMY